MDPGFEGACTIQFWDPVLDKEYKITNMKIRYKVNIYLDGKGNLPPILEYLEFVIPFPHWDFFRRVTRNAS